MKVDGGALTRDQWAVPFPIDPGKHTLSFAAPGRQPHDQSVLVDASGTVAVVVEPLQPETATPAASPPATALPPPAPQDATAPLTPTAGGDRTLAWIVSGVGVAALGVGGGFGLRALALRNQADPECPNKQCSPHGKSLIDAASTAATVATIGFAVGAVGLGVGTWLLVRPLPAGGASVALQGSW